MRKTLCDRDFSATARRMQVFEKFAPRLAQCALDRLALTRRSAEA